MTLDISRLIFHPRHKSSFQENAIFFRVILDCTASDGAYLLCTISCIFVKFSAGQKSAKQDSHNESLYLAKQKRASKVVKYIANAPLFLTKILSIK